MTVRKLDGIEARIGYKFKNARLIEAAFTHSSYINEHDTRSNERIEFLGDCVLNFLVGESLFLRDRTASEGALSARRAAIVSRAPLARLVDELGFLEYLRVGAGVDKSAFSDKARSDVYEALVGAVYLDGGLDECRRFLKDTFFGKVEPERDYKSELQELASVRGYCVEYATKDAPCGFESTVVVNGREFFGRGRTKRLSQIDAARCAVEKFGK